MDQINPIVKESLFSFKKPNPYYIYCPPIKIHSAGVSVMHRLCNTLNRMGYPAYLIVEREYLGIYGYPKYPTYSGLVTPELTDEIAFQHSDEGLTPIVIYPDAVKGHPLETGFVCRYMLNYPGLLGGETEFNPNEMTFSYSHKIAQKTPHKDQVLFIPISDPYFFTPPENNAPRAGACYYAAKYKYFHGQTISSEIEKHFEITRDQSTSLTKEGLRDLFRRSELFYCYENSALAIEAALCGCPVVFMPNEFFTEVIAENELELDGFAWGASTQQIELAKKKVPAFREKYIESLKQMEQNLTKFITLTQARARDIEYPVMVNLNKIPTHIGFESPKIFKISRALSFSARIFKNHTLAHIFKEAGIRLLKRIGIFKEVKAVKNFTTDAIIITKRKVKASILIALSIPPRAIRKIHKILTKGLTQKAMPLKHPNAIKPHVM